jgi:Uma2 family endonuclease
VFNPFITSDPSCNTFTYEAKYETYFSLPSYILFDQSSRSFTVYTTDLSLLANSYLITVYGTQAVSNRIESFSFKVTI